eukprot:158519_1
MTDYLQYLVINNNTDPYTDFPTAQPTLQPTWTPTFPSKSPTYYPTVEPTWNPSIDPTYHPSVQPTHPTNNPTELPSWEPSADPTHNPLNIPTTEPTVIPTSNPSIHPTTSPTMQPSRDPSANPSSSPTPLPTTSNPTWSPFTPPPSSKKKKDPYIIEIHIEIDCETESWLPTLYPPTINQMMYELLTPKFEKEPNVWVNTNVIQTDGDDECYITIESMYSTHILSNAQQINDYVNTTLREDLLNALQDTFGITLEPSDTVITFDLFIKQTTAFPITTQDPEQSNTALIMVQDNTDGPTVMILHNKDVLQNWLFVENNVYWVVTLAACGTVLAFCAVGFCVWNHHHTKELLRKHKREIQKFTTLSSTMPSSPYRPHKLTNQTSDDDDDDDEEDHHDGDGTHLSPVQAMIRNRHGTAYQHVSNNISPDGYGGLLNRPHWNMPINMTLQRMQMMHGLNDMSNGYMHNTYPSYIYPSTFNNHMTYGVPRAMDGTTPTDDMDGKTNDEPDGSTTTDFNIPNRSRRDTFTTLNSNNLSLNSNLYNDSERMDYKDREDGSVYGEDDRIEPSPTNTPQTQSLDTPHTPPTRTPSKSHTHSQRYQSYSRAKHGPNNDYLMVKGMGITPSLVALGSGSTKENLTISIKQRHASKSNSNLNECDDYKTSDKVRHALPPDRASVSDDTELPPPSRKKGKEGKGKSKSKMRAYRQSIALAELRPISPSPMDPNGPPPPPPPVAMSDVPTLPPESEDRYSAIFEENEHDKEYEDMYTDPQDGPPRTYTSSTQFMNPRSKTTDSMEANTTNSEEW